MASSVVACPFMIFCPREFEEFGPFLRNIHKFFLFFLCVFFGAFCVCKPISDQIWLGEAFCTAGESKFPLRGKWLILKSEK